MRLVVEDPSGELSSRPGDQNIHDHWKRYTGGVSADDLAQKTAAFRRWVEEHASLWSHVHISGVALKVADDWIAVRIGVILADRATGLEPWGAPIILEEPFLAFRTSMPFCAVFGLLDAAQAGVLPAQTVPGLDMELRMSPTKNGTPRSANFREHVQPAYGTTSDQRTWTHAELTLEGETPSAAIPEPWTHYSQIEHADRRFIRHAHGSFATLASRIGLSRVDRPTLNTLWNEPITIGFVAPIPIRVAGVTYLREKEVVRVDLDIGPRVPRDQLSVAFRPAESSAWFPPKRVRSKQAHVSIEVARRPPTGRAEVSLCFDPIGEIQTSVVTVEPPLRPSPFCLGLGRLDREHQLLTQGLAGSDGVQFERAIAILFGLLGYATAWWGPEMKKLPRPGDLQPGAAPDVMAFHSEYGEFLVVECTIGVVGSDKVSKLVARTLRVRNALKDSLGRQAPTVRPLLAVASSADEVGDAAVAAVRENHGGLLAHEDARALLRMLREGVTPTELRAKVEGLFESGAQVNSLGVFKL